MIARTLYQNTTEISNFASFAVMIVFHLYVMQESEHIKSNNHFYNDGFLIIMQLLHSA